MVHEIEQALAMLAAPPAPAGQQRRATVTVCSRAARGFDLTDPEQLRAAASLARPVLEMLGLVGADRRCLSRAERKQVGSKVVHGTRSAVLAHREAGHEQMCAPCARWLDVESRKPRPAPDPGAESLSVPVVSSTWNGSATRAGGDLRPAATGRSPVVDGAGEEVRLAAPGLPAGGVPGVQGCGPVGVPVRRRGRQ